MDVLDTHFSAGDDFAHAFLLSILYAALDIWPEARFSAVTSLLEQLMAPLVN
jgi:uncharacterized protein YggT (Ycf19 family)